MIYGHKFTRSVMELYLDYFENLTDFVYKKDIIANIEKLHNVKLDNDMYTKLIKSHLSNNIIAKSTNSPGKCAYISTAFLNQHNLDAVAFFQSKRIDAHNTVAFIRKAQIEPISADAIFFTDIETSELFI